MVDVIRCDVSTLDRLSDDSAPKLPGRNILQATAEIADRRADTG